jgi:hypothetical protein
MTVELAEAHIVGRRFRPHWATTTATTIENELPDISVASEVALPSEAVIIYVAVPYARMRFSSLLPSLGTVLRLEGAPEQVGHVEDAIETSTFVTHFLAAATASDSPFSHQYRPLLPSLFFKDEVLDWDVVIEVSPPRPSGTLAVTLEYAGRGTPTSVENPWD